MTVASVKAGVFVAFALLQLVSPGLSLSLSWCDAERTGMIDFDNVEFVESSVVKAPPSVGSYYCLPTETAARIPTTANGTDEGTEEFTRETRTASYIDITDIYESDDEVQIEYTSTSAPPSDALRSSCIHEAGDRRIVELSTDSATFDALENSQLYLTVGAWRMPVRFYANGLHLVSADFEQPVPNRYVYPSSQPVYIAVLVLDDDNTTLSVSSRKSYTVCEKAGNVYDQVDNTILYLELRNPEICTTFPELRDELFHEFVMLVDNKVAFMEKSHWVLVSTVKDCRDEQQREDTARIIFFSSEPEITTTTTLATPDGTPTDERPTDTTGGPSGGAIAGGVLGGVVLALCFGLAAVLAIIVYLRKRRTEPKPSGEQDLPGEQELAERGEARDSTSPPPTPQLRENVVTYVWKVCQKYDLEDVELLLAKGNLGVLPENTDSHCLIALIRKEACHTFYLVYENSPESLMSTNREAWVLLKDLSMRSLPAEVLQKFVAVRVYEEREGAVFQDELEGPILTVNLSVEKWRANSKERAEWITSRARTNRSAPDGDFSYSQTPSLTESPPRKAEHLQAHAESEQLQTSTDPPAHAEQDMALSTVPPQPQSHEQPPPTYNATVLHSILGVLERINETGQRNLEVNQRTANNTGGMAEAQREIGDITADTNETVHRSRVAQDTPDNV